MSATLKQRTAGFVLTAACMAGATADDKAEYDRRAAARYAMLFQTLDRDADGRVTRAEAQGDLNFSPRFADMDINRDGVVTTAELQRFIALEHGINVSLSQR